MTTEAPGTTAGSAAAPQPSAAAAPAGAPAVQAGAAPAADNGGQGAGASAVAAAAAAAGVDLKALYQQYPGLKEQIDREVVSSAIKGYRERELDKLTSEAEKRAEQSVAQRQQAAQLARLAQQAQSSDPMVRDRALSEIGKLQLQTYQTQQQSTQAQEAELAMARNITVEFMKNVMEIEVADLPPEVSNMRLSEAERVAALREFILDQSPAVQKKIGTFQQKAGVDRAALDGAAEAATFAARLAATPSPALAGGGGGLAGGDATSPLTDAEWEAHRSSFAWRQANEARIKQKFWPGQ